MASDRLTLLVIADGHRVALRLCPTCGALVADAELHERWHEGKR
jgi:ribosomal protein S27AE